MEQKEIDVYNDLIEQFELGCVLKGTSVKARDVYNKYNPTKKVTYCMCTSVKRSVYAKQFLEWYEGFNR